MPSFFSKKTRSQQAAGESPSSSASASASASTVAGAVLPPPPLTVPLPDDSYQLHLHQRPSPLSDSLDARFNLNPSASYSSYGVPRPHSPHSPHPATTEPIDLRYGQNLPPDPQQQQQQQQQQQKQQQHQYQHQNQQQLPPAPPPLQPPYRHPAHNLPSQPSLDRPTISLVTASTDAESDSINQPNLNSDHRTTTTTTTTTQGSSPKSLSTSSKLQKKKKGSFFNRDIATDTTTPATTKQPKSLARSASIKHSFGRGLDKDTSVSILPSSAEYESTVTPSAAATTTTTGILDPHSPSRPSQRVETESSSRPPTGGEIPPSPGWQYTSSSSRLPPTPQSEYPHSSRELTGPHFDRNESISQHGRSESLESIESQALLHPHLNSAVGDMSTTKQSDTTPTRKNSLAAPSSTPYGPSASQPSFKNSSQQNLTDMQGRETPPSAQTNSKLREELETLDVGALIQRHVELQSKYQRVKRYYFEKDAQVTQLQNTVAHQRMAVSRTVLDDNEYTARFVRLDGAIKQLAFSIRKDWRSVPEWLHPYVNQDAVNAGSKEMTAVGRAVISRWVVDEIFNRYFHPGLDRGFSERLKIIELNLRRQQFQVFNDDDKENQVARISNWRRTTLDGLVDQLQSKPTLDNLNQLAEYLVEKLSAALQCSLKEPAPPELDHIARTIVENAINIAEKIPQEARDIVVDYIVPGSFVSESNMRVETGLPALTRPMAQVADLAGEMTDDGMEIDNRDSTPAGASSPSSPSSHQQQQQIDQQQGKSTTHIPQNRDQRKKYPFGNLISKKTASPASQPTPSQGQSGDGNTGNTGNKGRDESTPSQQQQQQQSQEKRARVRLATFMMVEVKGRGPNNVLVPAPVYTIEQ